MDMSQTQASNDPSAPKPPGDPVPWLLAAGGFALVALVAGAALHRVEQHEAKLNVTATIRKLLSSHPYWSRETPQEINQGNCEDFMMDVCALVPGAQERTTGVREDDNRPGHYWVYFKGRHYDAETPEGVRDENDLPIFQRARRSKTT